MTASPGVAALKRVDPSIDGLLADLYASVSTPERFVAFAARLRDRMNSHLVALQADDAGHAHQVLHHFADEPIDVAQPDYAEDASVNLYFVRGAATFWKRGIINGSTLFRPGELERTAFYRQCLAPIDVHWSMGFCLSASTSGELVALSVSRDRHRPDFEPSAMHFAERLLPHLRNVYDLQQRLRTLESMASGMDYLAFAVWCLDADGRVCYANAIAHALVAEKMALGQRDARLIPCWPADRPAFRAAIERATRRVESGRSELLLHDALGRTWAACDIHPVHTQAFAELPLRKGASAVVFVHRFETAQDHSLALRQVFGLTAAETSLACALLRHGSLAESIRETGKRRETLRFHLKSLFAKTETHRQADLVKRLQATIG